MKCLEIGHTYNIASFFDPFFSPCSQYSSATLTTCKQSYSSTYSSNLPERETDYSN